MLARIFNPDPAKRIPLAKLRRHPWLHGAPSVLNAAYHAESAAAAPGDSAADEAAASAQSEEGIQQARALPASLLHHPIQVCWHTLHCLLHDRKGPVT